MAAATIGGQGGRKEHVGLLLSGVGSPFLFPPLLQKISVAYYLQSLCRFQISQRPVAILAEPSPVWLAVPGLVGVTLVALAQSCWRVRRFEVSQGQE